MSSLSDGGATIIPRRCALLLRVADRWGEISANTNSWRTVLKDERMTDDG